MIKHLLPKTIIESKGIDNAKLLLIKRPLQVGLNYPLLATTKRGYIIFDFGSEIRGGIRILTSNIDQNLYPSIRIRFGESLSECNSNIGENGACNDHSQRDITYSISQYSDISLGETGFRFVRIDFLSDVTIRIQNIYAKSECLSLKTKYEYKGNDNQIKQIFKVAKHTIDLCSYGKYIWDGVKRDRLVWYGDLHPEMIAITTIYGKTKQVENSLHLATKEYPLPSWMNNFPTYSMWWLSTVCDYCTIINDYSFFLSHLDYIKNLVSQMNECVDNNGEMHYPFYFVDWPTYQTKDAEHGSRYINIACIKKYIKALTLLNKDDLVARTLLNKLLKVTYKITCKQLVGLKYMAYNEINEEEYKLAIDGDSAKLSTFMAYYILEAIASINKEKAIRMLKEYYMGMIDLGATTFFEDFDLAYSKKCHKITELNNNLLDFHKTFGDYCYKGYRHSLCHGWSCGIVKFIYDKC